MNGSSFSATVIAVYHQFSFQSPRLEWSQIMTHVRRLIGEEYNLVELREVCQEVIDSRPLCGSPSLYSLKVSVASAPYKSGFGRTDSRPMKTRLVDAQGR